MLSIKNILYVYKFQINTLFFILSQLYPCSFMKQLKLILFYFIFIYKIIIFNIIMMYISTIFAPTQILLIIPSLWWMNIVVTNKRMGFTNLETKTIPWHKEDTNSRKQNQETKQSLCKIKNK